MNGSLPSVSRNRIRAKILIADDSEPNRNFLGDFMNAYGHEIMTAQNGRETLEKIHRYDPHLLLLDIMMPEMDGFEVLENLKRGNRLHRFPVIVVSAMDDMDGIIRCIEAGATDYLVKPFNAVLLRAKVDNCLDKKLRQDHERMIYENLSHSYSTLKSLEEARNDLAHIIVHDLNNPLSTIKGYTEYLAMKNKARPLSEKDLNRNIQKIANAISDMETLIQSILDVGKIESGMLEFQVEPLDAAACAREIYDNFSIRKGDYRRFTFHCERSPLPVLADPTLLSRVLLNLLNNAFKHTAKDSRIDLRLEREGERARFTVSDDGYGIPETLRERIFDKYVQVEGAKDGRKYGTGLGLYFCRMAMEGMGGTIGVNSEVGRGASFFIELPLKTGE